MHSIRFFLLIGLMAVGFTSCHKDEDGNFQGVRVSIDGTLWTAPTAAGLSQSGKITMTGTDPFTYNSLVIIVSDNITVGTYDIGVLSEAQCTYNEGLTAVFAPTTGSLTITEHDTASKRIKGTLAFEGTNILAGTSKNFTNGEFNLGYR